MTEDTGRSRYGQKKLGQAQTLERCKEEGRNEGSAPPPSASDKQNSRLKRLRLWKPPIAHIHASSTLNPLFFFSYTPPPASCFSVPSSLSRPFPADNLSFIFFGTFFINYLKHEGFPSCLFASSLFSIRWTNVPSICNFVIFFPFHVFAVCLCLRFRV